VIDSLNNNRTVRITLPIDSTILTSNTNFQVGYYDNSTIYTVADSSGNNCRPDESTSTLGNSNGSTANQINFANSNVIIVNSNQVKFTANSNSSGFDPLSLNVNDFIFSSDGSISTTYDNFNPIAVTIDSSDTSNRTLILIVPSNKVFNSSSALYLLSPILANDIRTKDIYSRNILQNSSKFISLVNNKLSNSYSPDGETATNTTTASNNPIASILNITKSRGASVNASQITFLNNSLLSAIPASVSSYDVVDWNSILPVGQYSMIVSAQNNPINININLTQPSTLSQALMLVQNSLGNNAYIMQEGNRTVIRSSVLGSSSSISVSAGISGTNLAERFKFNNQTAASGVDGDFISIDGQKYVFTPNGSILQTGSSNSIGVQIGWSTEVTANNLVNAINNNINSTVLAKLRYSSIVLTKKNTSDYSTILTSYSGNPNNMIITTIPVTSSYLATGDKFAFTFSHDIDTNSFKSAWNGSYTIVPGLISIGQNSNNKIIFNGSYNIGEIQLFSSIPGSSVRNLDGAIEYNSSSRTLTLTITSTDATNIILNGLMEYAPSNQLKTVSGTSIISSFKPLLFIGANEEPANNLPLFLNDYSNMNW
jgi:hypothetical protein